jgi:hypothetical protein
MHNIYTGLSYYVVTLKIISIMLKIKKKISLCSWLTDTSNSS